MVRDLLVGANVVLVMDLDLHSYLDFVRRVDLEMIKGQEKLVAVGEFAVALVVAVVAPVAAAAAAAAPSLAAPQL